MLLTHLHLCGLCISFISVYGERKKVGKKTFVSLVSKFVGYGSVMREVTLCVVIMLFSMSSHGGGGYVGYQKNEDFRFF